MASANGDADNAAVCETASKLRPGDLGHFQLSDLPQLLPASFRVCPALSSLKPPPPPLLPYLAGASLSVPRLWPRLLRAADLSSWAPSPPPCWLLSAPAPPLLPLGTPADLRRGPTAPADGPQQRRSRLDGVGERDRRRGVSRTTTGNGRHRGGSAEPQAKRFRSADSAVRTQSKAAHHPSPPPPAHIQKLGGVESDRSLYHCDTRPAIQTNHVRNGGNLPTVEQGETDERKLNEENVCLRNPTDATSDLTSNWFNPQEKDFNFSWCKNINLLPRPGVVKQCSD